MSVAFISLKSTPVRVATRRRRMTCARCSCVEGELRVVAEQLREARRQQIALQASLERANEYIRGIHAIMHTADSIASTAAIPASAISATSRRPPAGESAAAFEGAHPFVEAKFRSTPGFPWRYVPPLDFLPEPFVEQFADVLAIVDRYAQQFHRKHVGGAPHRAAGSKEDLERECLFLRSRVELLEVQLAQATTLKPPFVDGGISTAVFSGPGGRRRSRSQRSQQTVHDETVSLALPHASQFAATDFMDSTTAYEGREGDDMKSGAARRIDNWRRRRNHDLLPNAEMHLVPPAVLEAYERIHL